MATPSTLSLVGSLPGLWVSFPSLNTALGNTVIHIVWNVPVECIRKVTLRAAICVHHHCLRKRYLARGPKVTPIICYGIREHSHVFVVVPIVELIESDKPASSR